jgi:bifunctional DNA-binding transcriptional regulator/antitoxin component of YhaV-PrlF toxin-antitoxin module
MAKREKFVAFVNANNAITIPEAVRGALNIVPGSTVAITIEKRIQEL